MFLYNDKEMSAREIKALNPNTSYKCPTQVGAIAILPTPKPECGELERVTRDGVTTDALGNTVQAWKIVDMFSDTEEATKAEQETEYLAKLADDAIEARNKLVETTIQDILDTEATDAGYDSIISACSYMGSINFGAEAKTFLDWRDAVWTYIFTVQLDVLSGAIQEPTMDELLAGLPTRS